MNAIFSFYNVQSRHVFSTYKIIISKHCMSMTHCIKMWQYHFAVYNIHTNLLVIMLINYFEAYTCLGHQPAYRIGQIIIFSFYFFQFQSYLYELSFCGHFMSSDRRHWFFYPLRVIEYMFKKYLCLCTSLSRHCIQLKIWFWQWKAMRGLSKGYTLYQL